MEKGKEKGKEKGEIREGGNERKTGNGKSGKKGRVGKGKLGRGNGWKWIGREGDRLGRRYLGKRKSRNGEGWGERGRLRGKEEYRKGKGSR